MGMSGHNKELRRWRIEHGQPADGNLGHTKCWTCAKACKGCSWSRYFIPVPGWNAVETRIDKGDGNEPTPSYHVIDCPEYVNDETEPSSIACNPCPTCGGRARFVSIGKGNRYRVHCGGTRYCTAPKTTEPYLTKREALEAWNKGEFYDEPRRIHKH